MKITMAIETNQNPLGASQIDAILPYMGWLEQRELEKAGSWQLGDPGIMPYYRYSPKLIEFIEALDQNGWLATDVSPDWGEFAFEFVEHPELLDSANVVTIGKLLSFHSCQNRFVEGYFPSLIDKGHILAILRRSKRFGRPCDRDATASCFRGVRANTR